MRVRKVIIGSLMNTPSADKSQTASNNIVNGSIVNNSVNCKSSNGLYSTGKKSRVQTARRLHGSSTVNKEQPMLLSDGNANFNQGGQSVSCFGANNNIIGNTAATATATA